MTRSLLPNLINLGWKFSWLVWAFALGLVLSVPLVVPHAILLLSSGAGMMLAHLRWVYPIYILLVILILMSV